MINIERELKTAIRTGKVILGSKSTIKTLKLGKSKMIIIASNCPIEIREDIEYYCKLSSTPYYIYPGNSWELGALCGKPFMVAAFSINDPGESNILSLVESEEG